MTRTLVCLLLVSIVDTAAAQFTRVGTSAAQFLKFPADPRTAALGGSAAATHGDVAALFQNPAGIASIRGIAAGFAQAQLYADISYNFAGATVALGERATIGVSAFYLSSGEMEQTTVAEPNGTGARFSVRNYAFGITYAQYVTEWLMIGGSVKYLREDLWRETASSVGFDIGSVLETGVLGSRLGICLSNFGPDMQLAGEDLRFDYQSPDVTLERGAALTTEAWPLPLTFRVGLALDLIGGANQLVESSAHALTVMGDYNEPNDSQPRGNVGLEYAWEGTLFARLGYYTAYDAAQMSYGLGLRTDIGGVGLRVDYALVDYRVLGFVHQYALGVAF